MIALSFLLAFVFICISSSFRLPHRSRCLVSMATEGDAISLKSRLSADMKEAMKSKQKVRLAAIRAIQTAIKQKEVDERIEVDENLAIDIMSKMVKQRKESIKSYADAGRADLVEQEEGEMKEIQAYMPQQATAEEIEALVTEAIVRLEAKSVKDMNKVMTEMRPRLAGRADMGEVGAIIKKKLTS